MKYAMLMVIAVAVLEGCTMFSAWKSIPPPGGCDQCHTVAISSNWQVTYKAATVADERTRQAFQTPEYNMPVMGRQESPVETKKVEELRCFECHKSPSPPHLERKGRFHH
ncbi:cytochrome C [Geobacter sp. SVR]|uniref:cytochrome C n=1 Tax=Geobacter sp. SVR TaxID=2495594 RepID=UPI00143F037F|nr:cytochrome C [Geobacter sp. SVR]BCS56088.1 cytochrome c [Geobacter sp. SVR]GCF84851.1 cytochrome c [Geobacter sp. SVR]